MRIALALFLAAAASPAAAEEGTEEPEATSGVISGAWGYVEILPEAPPPGTTIQLEEGWIRVESAPADEEPGSGSFGVISAEALAAEALARGPRVRTEPQPGLEAAPGRPGEPRQPGYPPAPRRPLTPAPLPPPEVPPLEPPPVSPELGPCYEEREAYARRLFEIAGIEDVEHPLALLEGLGQSPVLSPWVRFNLFGLAGAGPWGGSVAGVDPVRPLAWDEDLQYEAKALSACMRAHLGFDDRLVDPDLERRRARPQLEEQRLERQEPVLPPRPRGLRL